MSYDADNDFEQNLAGSVAMQYSQPHRDEDTTIDEAMQDLLLHDTDVQRILKGNISEPVDKLNAIIAQLEQKPKIIDADTAQERLLIDSKEAQDIKQVLQDIQKQLTEYKSMVPFLFALSPLIKVSNLSTKDADDFCKKVDLMITRYKISAKKIGNTLVDNNFFDSYKMIAKANFLASVNGWHLRTTTEHRRYVTSNVNSPQHQKKKKRFGGLF